MPRAHIAIFGSSGPPPLMPPSEAVAAAADTVLIGSHAYSGAYRVGPADRASAADLTAAIAETPAWTTFWGDQFERLSPSRNGVRATSFVRVSPWGNLNRFNEEWQRLVNGVSAPLEHIHSAEGNFAGYLATYGAKPGARGVGLPTAFTTYHGHTRVRVAGIHQNPGTWSMAPQIPQWIGLQMDGQFVFLMRDGSISHPFKIPGAVNAHDWSLNPPPNNIKLIYVADTGNGRILKIDRTPAFTDPENPNFEDFSLWEVSVFSTGFSKPTSVRAVQDGNIYVADELANTISKITPAGVKTTLLSVAQPFWIDYTSTGNLVVATRGGHCYIIDPSNPNLSTQVNPNAGANNPAWVTVSVDRNGTFGPVDEFTFIAVHSTNNTQFWRYEGGAFTLNPISGGLGNCSIGPSTHCDELFGHYPWVAEHHPDEAIILVQGVGNINPAIVAVTPPNFPAIDTYDHPTFNRGRDILIWGAGEGTLHHTYPSFSCQMGYRSAWSLIGCTADWLAQKTFQELSDFIKQGMFGSFPREAVIKGRDLHALMYVIYRSSQRWLNEGATLMSSLLSFCTPTFGQELPAIAQPSEPVNSQTFARVDRSGANLQVNFFSNFENAKTPEAGLVLRLYVDEGLPAQMDLGLLSSPWTIAIPGGLPAGQHSLRAVPHASSTVVDLNIYRGLASVLVLP